MKRETRKEKEEKYGKGGGRTLLLKLSPLG
jgi:hypothetical protein